MAPIDPTPTARQRLVELLPWLFVAALLHLTAFLALSLWKPDRTGPGDTVVPVSIVTSANPFAASHKVDVETRVDPPPEPQADPAAAIPRGVSSPADEQTIDPPATAGGPNDAAPPPMHDTDWPADRSANLDIGLTANGPAIDPGMRPRRP
ncbi:MAG: hypothetical protein IID40_08715, partial [Planctomycetes bacterium]|nr:hypothetical protein [Planctomycetota bacterium]